jgi:hypothetical protein
MDLVLAGCGSTLKAVISLTWITSAKMDPILDSNRLIQDRMQLY